MVLRVECSHCGREYRVREENAGKRLQEIAGMKTSIAGSGTSAQFSYTLAPVGSVNAFADLIDFGTVSNIDEANRTISVTADQSYTFTKGAGSSLPPFIPSE